MKPHYNVVGAVIIKDGKVLALRRSDGNESVIHKFEFVGGKVEQGETPEAALERECMEEISLKIRVGELFNSVDYEYSDCIVTLSLYFVKPLSGYELKVHEEEKWIACADLDPSEWAPADGELLNSLKTGYVQTREAESADDYNIIRSVAYTVMHETFDETTPQGQVDYMINLFLSDEAITENKCKKQYSYRLFYLNGEVAGFCAYCPAHFYKPEYTEGTFLSKIYILGFARRKRITSRLLDSLRRPVYLTVKRDNAQSINIYKHCGFKIVESVSADIGEGYVMDDFVMMLSK